MKKSKLKIKIVPLIVLLISFVGYIYLSFNLIKFALNDSGFIKYIIFIGLFVLLVINILLNVFIARPKKKKKVIKQTVLILLAILIALISLYIGENIRKGLDSVTKIVETTITYSASLVKLVSNPIDDVSNIKNKKIGIISDKNSVDGYIIGYEIIDENKLAKDNDILAYDSFPLLINALYSEEVDFVIIPSNYVINFRNVEGFENIETETTAILNKKKEQKNETKASDKKLTEPFSFLILGVDSMGEDYTGSANGDAILVGTFNPNTLNATLVSIPRDTYTKVTCQNTETKITHAGWGGVSCMQDTIEKLFDIKIDYYVTINFKGVVHLVDALGGIEIDVPIEFCEQNSNRSFAQGDLICLNEGVQTLNGEEALAFSRHRKTLLLGDITRGKHQQMVIEAAMKKATNIRSVDEVQRILDTISVNMKTNMDLSQIISFYEVGLNILESASNDDVSLNIQHMTLSGYDQRIFEENSNLVLYNYIPYLGSAKDISNAMKQNLGLATLTPIKTFSFSINEPFEPKNIGAGQYSEGERYPLFGNYVGKDITTVTKNLNAKGITVKVVNVPGTSSMSNGQIVNQDVNERKRMDRTKTVTFTVVKKEEVVETAKLSIELNGGNVTIAEGSNYTDAGYKVFDGTKNITSSITDKSMTITNSSTGATVSKITATTPAGTYKIKYTVTYNGVTVSATRTVQITPATTDGGNGGSGNTDLEPEPEPEPEPETGGGTEVTPES